MVKATETSGQDFMLVMKAAEKQEVQFSTLPIQTRLVFSYFYQLGCFDCITNKQSSVLDAHFIIFQERQSAQNISICVVVACVVMQYAQVYLNFAINGEV